MNQSLITLSNALSFVRAPLAFVFLQENTTLRLLAIVLAMVTDSIDGYFARRRCSVSRFGTVLDPTMDKFFVYFVLVVFYFEQRISVLQIGAMLSRDVALFVYSTLMTLTGKFSSIQFNAIRWGKITTALQFVVLMCLTSGFSISFGIYLSFVVMGLLAFIELVARNNPFLKKPQKTIE
jgi:phosphatidylglycerophosphate synthase